MFRAVILICTALLALLATHDAALAWWRTQDEVPGSALLASNPELASLQWARILSADPRQLAASTVTIERDARAVLRTTPLETRALRQLGQVAETRQIDRGTTLLELAGRTTRRDVATELLLISHAARKGDAAGTLAHYDHALLVSPASAEFLFVPLTAALVAPDIRHELARYAGRPWFAAFLNQALAQDADAAAVLALLSEAKRQVVPAQAQDLGIAVLGALVSRQDFAAARDVVGTLPLAQRTALGTFGISRATTDDRLAPLSWRLGNDDAVTTELANGGALDVTVASERTGVVAERITLFAPGTYRLRAVVAADSNAPEAHLTWDMRCLAGDAATSPLEPAAGDIADERNLIV